MTTKNRPLVRSRARLQAVALLAAGLLAPRAPAQFTPTGAGPFDYNTTGNWNGGTINGVFSQTPSAAQSVTFGANSTLTTGLTFSLGGSSKSLTLRGDGTERTVTLGGDVSVSGTTSAITLGSTTAGNGLNVVLGADRTFSVASGNTLYVNNVVSGGNALTKAGAGQLTFAGANTYTGTTTVNGGTLFLNGSGTLNSGNNVVINSASTASLTLGGGFTQTIGTLTFGGVGGTASSVNNVTLNIGATLTLGGTVTFNANGIPTANPVSAISGGTLDLGGNRTFAVADSTGSAAELNISSDITGSGNSLTKTGTGRLQLTGANTYDGGTVLNGGVIFAGSSSALGTGPVTINNLLGATSTLGVNTGVGGNTTIGALTFGGGGAGATTNSQNDLGVNTSTLTLNGTVTYDATNNPKGSTIYSLSGGTPVTAGTLALGAGRIFNIGNSATTTNELTISAPIVSGGLIKTGPGTLRLSGANTYTGGTTVSAGGLFVSNTTGSGVGTGALTIESGASLYGTGTIGGATTILLGGALGSGGSGNAGGNLTFTNGLTLNNGAVFNFQLGTTSDKYTLTGGTLTGASTLGSLTINLTAGAGFGAGVYTLFDFSSGSVTTSSFDVSDFAFGTTISGFSYSLASTGNLLQLTASAIPEPSTYAAIAGAAMLGLAVWRRSKQNRPAEAVLAVENV